MSEYRVIGRSLPRVDGLAKVTGQAIYATDLVQPGMLCGKILYSDRPHARIVGIDTRRARALPGVEAVITSADAPARRYGNYIQDQTIFATDRVLHVGQPVAAVAATSDRIAERALAAIEVTYEDLPAVFDPESALQPGAPLLHPEVESYTAIFPAVKRGNLCSYTRLEQGDVEEGFRRADHVFEETYRVAPAHQAYLEPHACLAGFDHNGKLTVWTSTQQLSTTHGELAAALHIPMTHVRVVPVWLGGGFGGKLKTLLEPICCLLAKATRRPVKMELTRREEFHAAHPRAPYLFRLKTGVRSDGTLLAHHVRALADCGAFADHVAGTAIHGAALAHGPYHIPNCLAEARVAYTNNGSFGCMRGYGIMELTFANESHMDAIAHGLGMDPARFRLRNLVAEGDVIVTTQHLRSVHARECLEAALEQSGYWEKKGQLGPGRGIGVAAFMHDTGLLGSSATVRVNPDATIAIQVATSDIGTGSYTAICQIAAEVLQAPIERVEMPTPDSETSPYDFGSIDSRTIYDIGNAVRLAAEDVCDQAVRLTAATLGCSGEEIVHENGRYYPRSHPEQALDLRALAAIAVYARQGPLLGRGSWMAHPPFEKPVGIGFSGGPCGTFLFGAHVAEVEVDRETGRIQVLGMTAVHDAGRVLNPAGIEGQVEGGVVQGIGAALYEKLLIREGRVVNDSFTDYCLPTALDVPPIRSGFVEIPDPTGPFGAKGVGEPPLLPPPAAIANAVFDAVGVRLTEMPITPEVLFNRMEADSG
jgi:CO/xanthine dehydrogenase Mo-binding subunit